MKKFKLKMENLKLKMGILMPWAGGGKWMKEDQEALW